MILRNSSLPYRRSLNHLIMMSAVYNKVVMNLSTFFP
uniref:p4 n=1 Tax=Lettuce chlorosis virus TaxID=642478 RepID=A0A223HBN8_9CLOS|nr:p4 [Lettuce chlorosis virus]